MKILSRMKARSAPTPELAEEESGDEDWDTDLEDEDSTNMHDTSGRTAYREVCERLGVVPVSYFTRHISDQQLTMRYHGLGPVGTKAIAKVLRANVHIEKLNLAGNWMEAIGGIHIAHMLLENEYISELNLSDNKLGSVGGYHVAKTLNVNTALRHVDLAGNGFAETDAEYFAGVLEQNKFLKSLNISRNRFGEMSGLRMGPAIGTNDVLEHLDLSWNEIRREGAVSVARGLKENIRIKTCNLSWNGFGPEGGAALADAIATNEALIELDISGNRLDIQSALLIAKAISTNEQLQILRIGNNPISTMGCIALAKSIKESEVSILTCLDLKDIPVEYEFLAIVDEIRKKRPDFEVVYGSVMRSGNTPEDIGKRAVDPSAPKDPLLVLQEHLIVNDTRILDILAKFDPDDTKNVTPEQFTSALEELGVPYTKEQLDDIAKKLGKNEDGMIYYG
ncbi:hypothetical protein NP493_430g03017 [Ridgeia piscesae]|uniref:EF-hand domain-containing protein n=1 Tax=Ridgeia piscesae TaxID=27915 RepID=A0AAD9NV69_RIDPI|nr:hypothetical protein NP493_430g03017 [Ridgeia piscesae]